LLHRPVVACSSAQKHTASTALLSLLLLNQPGLVRAEVQAKFVEVPRLENPLMPPINVGYNAKPTFADIDGDGDFDAFVDTKYGTVKYYENIGNITHPILKERTDENNPLNDTNGIITLVDIDNDKDLDAFIGGTNGVEYYKNVGDANQPIFEQHTEEKNPLNGVSVKISEKFLSENFSFSENVFAINFPFYFPFFVDIDGDSDLDVFIDTHDKYFENTGSINKPTFDEPSISLSGFDEALPPKQLPPDFKNSGAYHFVDIDNDGDMDAFTRYYGIMRYYENTSTAKKLSFFERTEQDNPLNDVNIGSSSAPPDSGSSIAPPPDLFVPGGSSSAPTLIDIDGDSDLDAFIGTSNGTIKYYKNEGSKELSVFVERTNLDNPFGGLVDDNIRPTLVDIDNDGDLDAFTAMWNENEPVKYYENNINSPSFVERIEQDNPLNGVIALLEIALLDIDADGDLDAFIGTKVEFLVGYMINTYNTIKYYENTGNASHPNFKERIDDASPLNRIQEEYYGILKPYFIDADSDRDFDVFINGDYYENTGSINHHFFVKRLDQDNPLTWV
jgi:hypothetical protein